MAYIGDSAFIMLKYIKFSSELVRVILLLLLDDSIKRYVTLYFLTFKLHLFRFIW